MAHAYPKVWVDGFDVDESAIEEAWANACKVGLTDRLTFHARDAGDLELLNGSYDLVIAFACFHDLGNPVGVLRTMRRLAGHKGTVLVMAEHQPSATTGTVMRADMLQRYAQEAGFRQVEVLPLDNAFFNFYRLHG
jgi:ubiquinone/menaquinone biosynthesis C-methylase UbiE